MDFNYTIITTILGGASPESMEKLVVNVIEPRLREVEGIKLIRSTATESRAVVVVQLDPDARDPDQTNTDIQKVVDRLDELPKEADKPTVRSIDSRQTPIIEVNVSSGTVANRGFALSSDVNDASDASNEGHAGYRSDASNGHMAASPFELRAAAKQLYDELNLIDEVSSITKIGYLKREFSVEVDTEKLAQRRIPLNALIRNINQNNISIPGGSIKSREGSEVLVRTESQFKNKEDLLKTVLLTNDAGFETRLSDVAQVRESLAEPTTLYRADGKESIILRIAKKINGDALTLVSQIKQRVSELKESLGRHIDVTYSNDLSVYLSNRLGILSWNLVIGLLLVTLILIFFLPWQVTLVVSIGIPLALLATLMTVSALGFSLNLISLLGLIIVLGMLVDDAIVVCENIWRHVEKGHGKAQAVVEGTCEVFIPILASILTTVSAFAPMLFMSGVFGAFVFQIPVMVILALAFSLLEAFFIMPAHFASWVNPFLKPQKKAAISHKKKWFDNLKKSYQTYVGWSLKFRYALFFIAIIIIAVTLQIITTKGQFILFPGKDIEIFFVKVEAPTNVSLEEMSQRLLPIEESIAQLPSHEIKDFTSSIGVIQTDPFDPQTKRGSNYANIRITLSPKRDRERSAEEIVEELRTSIGSPEELTKIQIETARRGPPQGRAVSIDLMGQHFDEIQAISQKIKDQMGEIEGLIDIEDSFIQGKKEWQIQPRFEDMTLVGVTSSDVALSVRAAFEGVVASSLRYLDEEVDIRVRLKREKGEGDEWENPSIGVGNRLGQLTPLREIANFKLVETLSSIQHVNHRRVISISAGVDTERITALAANNQIRPIVANVLKEYPGYSVRYGGEERDTKESLRSLFVAFIFAACVIFVLLTITFKNILQPLVILTSIPMGFIGATYALWLHGHPFSFMALLGIIALAGVIVNNAIVFTDFVNQRRRSGVSLNHSIIETAGVRLRPILLTTITTVSGLLPTAYGETLQQILGVGGGDPFIVPIALSLGWGLAIGSVMTSLFFPSFIRILDDVRATIGRSRLIFQTGTG